MHSKLILLSISTYGKSHANKLMYSSISLLFIKYHTISV